MLIPKDMLKNRISSRNVCSKKNVFQHVLIILGSETDKSFAQKITDHLDAWEVPYKIFVASAHKVPEKVLEIVKKYNQTGENICYITIAGRSNGLSGVVAANAVHPCIACPPFKDKEDMILNLNSTVLMPSDTPVLTVIDPQNAALAATRILALSDPALQKKLSERIAKMKAQFE